MAVLPRFPWAPPPARGLDPLVDRLRQYLIDLGKPQALEEAVQVALKFQTSIQPASIGQPLTWVSDWIVAYARQMGSFMDTPESITTGSFESFLASSKYHINEVVVPPGGFKSFNELFARFLKPGSRPIDAPTDPRTIVFPACSSFDGAWQIQDDSVVNIRGLPWPIKALLQESDYRGEFSGGIWMHAFLNTFDYHCQHAPVGGIIPGYKVIQGAAYLEVVATTNSNGIPTLEPIRRYSPVLTRSASAPGDQVDAPDTPGYQFLQTRGLIMIDSEELGLVAVLPIGMAQVSSVQLNKCIQIGQPVEKGQQISNFLFGGSDIVLVFQQRAGLTLDSFPPVTDPPTHYNVGNKLAVGR